MKSFMNSKDLGKGVLFTINFKKAYDKFKWDFAQQVMERKGFPRNWIQKSCILSMGGSVCININGQRTPYFKTYEGLRQGVPLSPIIFNFVVDSLATLTRKATSRGKLKGVMDHLIPKGITHIQYTYVTILMVGST
jgi:hypothetical protein